jgi:hypothetical protein
MNKQSFEPHNCFIVDGSARATLDDVLRYVDHSAFMGSLGGASQTVIRKIPVSESIGECAVLPESDQAELRH